ncbi:2Fe-2S iron-sulfur cluster-binding protein [Saccharopolyspora mangrovi]|uniref:2Fe-2S iron-sulfur cluster-binding protein n=1 Tax=Saccharopolyspora mangrovi TaxID=3082379 RepID=A0ABU6AL91_9PSEU|nr:2Fe-2S iron-sulfur cluster-binding protein [Saccharopolyspora sp. S2-29]MEB3372319.1 2Fe-2S iron-sulfur cluster-binding protein [Saccharopolyspora sp. S2-29]
MRLSTGGRIDRTRTLRFTFDGVELTGHPGDTLASALLAAGRVEIARSTYLARPRGVLTADLTEPNALVAVGGNPFAQATEVELHDGLQAESVPGVGRLASSDSPDYYRRYAHADVVVIGGGPAGVAAAVAAGGTGARVLLVEHGQTLGGERHLDWITRALHDLTDYAGIQVPDYAGIPGADPGSSPPDADYAGIRGPDYAGIRGADGGVRGADGRDRGEAHRSFRGGAGGRLRILLGATAIGRYENGYLLVAQGRRMWHVRAEEVVLATGAHERPLVFAGNDRPGIMLASAVSTYLRRFAVLPGREAVVATTCDSAYATAAELAAAGCRVRAIVDSRPDPPPADVPVIAGATVVETSGRCLESVRLSDGTEIGCDLLAVSGGWSPVLHLHDGDRRWDDGIAAFRPVGGLVAGAANGTFDLPGCIAEGLEAGARAAGTTPPPPPDLPPEPIRPPRPVWLPPGEDTEQFVDLQRDATVADIRRAIRAGLRSVEHIKRYTTIGVGSDQGKTSWVNAMAVIAAELGTTPGEVGTPAFRPPYVPVPFAMMAARERGDLHDPIRTTPMHSWHVARGAVFEDVGQWRRARYYPRSGEDMAAAVHRECLAARTGVAMQDVSTLGRIEVVGPDAPEFLNRVYTGGFAKLPVGKGRYGIMCTADGMVLDDGVALRLAADRYLLSTTTGGAEKVLDWLEQWLQTEWPELEVCCTSVTEQWAAVAVTGPDSGEVVARLAPELGELAFLEFRDTALHNGVPARIARISFSGELAYEINVPSWYGLALWEDVGVTPYGTEAMHVLRAEKGFVIVGQDTDGTVTPLDLGMPVSQRKDFLGKRSLTRADTARADRPQLVGLLTEDPAELLPEGACLEGGTGHVTSSYRSPILGRTIALALVAAGRDRIGERLAVPLGEREVPVRVHEPVFYDPEGARRDGRR